MKTLLTLVIFSVSCVAQSVSSNFYDEHSTGVQQNPPGVTLTISTVDGRSTYHLSDIIRFKLSLSSKRRRAYTYETGANMAGVSDDLVVLAPGQRSSIHSISRVLPGTVCCSYWRQYLSEKPSIVIFRMQLSRMQRSLPAILPSPALHELRPGEYKVFIQTRRVFRGWPKSEADRHSYGLLLTSSNILSFSVLSDEGKTVRGNQQ